MKFSINQSELAYALGIVSKGASARSTLPVLSGILITASGADVVLEATNLDLSIRCKVSALVEEEGSTVVPSKLILDIVKSLPDSAIHIEANDEQATILCETSSFSIRTMLAEDFPGFPEVSPETSARIPFPIFSDMAKRVSKSASKDESRAILTGVLIEAQGDLLRMVATDSYRLAFAETRLENPGGEFKAVVAGSFLANVATMGAGEQDIDFEIAENQVIIHCGDTTFVNRRIEGNFPPYMQLLPEACNTRVTFDCKELSEAVRRISLMNDKTNPVRFDVNGASQTTQLSASSQDVGAASETLASGIDGEDVVIGFNPAYVVDGLACAPSNEVVLELQSSVRPGILKNQAYYEPATIGGERFAYVIMPIRLS
ncbi:MAG: DNA polymerase III subunit beta [Eggerthellaceae bacterium]